MLQKWNLGGDSIGQFPVRPRPSDGRSPGVPMLILMAVSRHQRSLSTFILRVSGSACTDRTAAKYNVIITIISAMFIPWIPDISGEVWMHRYHGCAALSMGFLRRVASCRRLTSSDPEAPDLESPLLLSKLSGSFSAPELAHRQQQAYTGPGPLTRISPRKMGPQKHRHFQQLAVAFLAGGLLTYLCTSLMGKAGAHLGFISSQANFLTR